MKNKVVEIVKSKEELQQLVDKKEELAQDLGLPKDIDFQEFKILMKQVLAEEINPFKKEGYFIPRWNKNTGRYTYTLVTSIDFLVKKASANPLYGGCEYEMKKIKNLFKKEDNGDDIVCVCIITKKDGSIWKESAIFSEYKTKNPLWDTMPNTMLEKCALAKALRKAYGIKGYIKEEFSRDAKIEDKKFKQISATTESTKKFTQIQPQYSPAYKTWLEFKRKQIGLGFSKDHLLKFREEEGITKNSYTTEDLESIFLEWCKKYNSAWNSVWEQFKEESKGSPEDLEEFKKKLGDKRPQKESLGQMWEDFLDTKRLAEEARDAF